MQREITQGGPLLNERGSLNQVGWSRFPLLDANVERAAFYSPPFHLLQFLRLKCWDYYAVFTPRRFFSATIADLGYAGNIFVYTLDFATNQLHEESLVIPLSQDIVLPRNSTEGIADFADARAQLTFCAKPDCRELAVDWKGFDGGKGIRAELVLRCPPEHESMNIVIPIGQKRFYYNRKINCLPAEGFVEYAGEREQVHPTDSLGSLDWGRGVWEYSSFWNWASASGFLPGGRTVGLNLGGGFGDTSAATENCLILDGRIHKLEQVMFAYDPHNYMQPWRFADSKGRLDLVFTPFRERLARTDLVVITSEVHQMFGRFSGRAATDDGESIELDGLVGFAEEHRARW